MSSSYQNIRSNFEAEYDLMRLFRYGHFTTCLIKDSNSYVIAGDGISFFVIAAKTSHNPRIKFKKQEILTLLKFAHQFKAAPWVALKYLGCDPGWKLVKPNTLEINEKSFSIEYNTACFRGFEIGELISNELQQRLV